MSPSNSGSSWKLVGVESLDIDWSDKQYSRLFWGGRNTMNLLWNRSLGLYELLAKMPVGEVRITDKLESREMCLFRNTDVVLAYADRKDLRLDSPRCCLP
jgi:hypothetical protein